MLSKHIISLLLISSLTGCSAMPDWLGASDTEKLEGNRISVLKTDSSLQADYNIEDMPVLIPIPQENTEWHKSKGYHFTTPQNPSSPDDLNKILKVSAGSAGSDIQKLSATPVIAEGKIFTLDGKGLVTAFDAQNINKKLWQFRIILPEKKEGDFAQGGITYHNGSLFITTGSNYIISLNSTNGSKRWLRTITSTSRSAPDAAADKVFINTAENKLYAVSADDGGILWTHDGTIEDISILGTASPLAQNAVVLAPYSSGELYALNVKNGVEVWSDDLSVDKGESSASLSDIDASPTIAGNIAYIVSNDGIMTATDVFTGQHLWEQEVASRTPAWAAGNFIYILDSKNELICIFNQTGAIRWVSTLPSYEDAENKKNPIHWSAPVLSGNYLRISSSDGRLLSVSPKDGSIASTLKIPSGVFLPPVVANNKIYLYSNNAELIEISSLEKNKK